MNIRLILSATALTAATLTSAGAFAQTAAPTTPVHTTDERQAIQHNRIKEGRESGELTKRESIRLHAEQRAIKRKERKAAADGVVTNKEQNKISRLQNGANKDIAKQKNDGQAPANK